MSANRASAPRRLLNRFRLGVLQLTPARHGRASNGTNRAASEALPPPPEISTSLDAEETRSRRDRRTDEMLIPAGHIRISSWPNDERIDSSKLKLLPTTAEAFYGDNLERFGWKGALEVLLAGTRDENSSLTALREHEATIVREIYSFLSNQWAGHVKLTVPAALVGRSGFPRSSLLRFNQGRDYPNWAQRTYIEDAVTTSSGFDDGFVAFAKCGHVEFPEPAARNVNMMPFILGDKDSLPSYLQCYFPLIEQCPYMRADEGKVVYLTVHESYVGGGESQRREGLHVESPGTFCDDATASSFTPGDEHPWGGGMLWGPDKYEGGIFMASNVADTSEVWDALVDNRVPGIVDRHGGCEHLRGLIGRGTKLRAGELVWMTDCTPHEALPQSESGYRQFFRVVMPSISHWYANHSTENPMVPLPSNVKVVQGNKFVQSLSELEA